MNHFPKVVYQVGRKDIRNPLTGLPAFPSYLVGFLFFFGHNASVFISFAVVKSGGFLSVIFRFLFEDEELEEKQRQIARSPFKHGLFESIRQNDKRSPPAKKRSPHLDSKSRTVRPHSPVPLPTSRSALSYLLAFLSNLLTFALILYIFLVILLY